MRPLFKRTEAVSKRNHPIQGSLHLSTSEVVHENQLFLVLKLIRMAGEEEHER